MITPADQLRLGVTIRDIADVARVEEGELWTFFTEVMQDGFALRPTNELLRALRETQRASTEVAALMDIAGNDDNPSQAKLPSASGTTMRQPIKVFISHSSKDQAFVRLLIDLLRGALNLPAEQIRCTSIDGYRLPAGASATEHLRREIHEAQAFIGVISAESLQSLYVAFELGARWGAGRHLIPVLAPGVDYSVLAAPLADLNALKSSSPAQLHQLVSDLASALQIVSSNPAAYQAQIDAIQKISVEAAMVSTKEAQANSPEVLAGLPSVRLTAEARQILLEAVRHDDPTILRVETMDGVHVQVNRTSMTAGADRRTIARWEAAVRQLEKLGLIEDRSHKGEVFDLTSDGWEIGDYLSQIDSSPQ